MSKIGIFYGSTTGNTEKVAGLIQKEFGPGNADLFNVDITERKEVEKYPYLIFGISTWGVSDLQDDFEDFMDVLEDIDYTGRKVALFGLGDQSTYTESFVDAMGIVYDRLKNLGAKIVGLVSREGYSFEDSMALVNGKLAGLALDEDFESHLTEERIRKWVNDLKKEFV
ncbi:MAG TPA: flavodoxin [Bacteroidales bacterium]|nr:flavodoxin [Bacteroidales bacterium]